MLRSQWQAQDFSQLPAIAVISGDILGNARGAYAKSTNTIYLSDRFVTNASQQSLEAVLLEEIGHFVDAKVNNTDTVGDEGELFSGLVRGVEISSGELQKLRTEDDSAIITIDGQTLQIEQAIYDPADYPTLPQDLIALEAFIFDRQLVIDFQLTTPFTVGNIEFYLDIDQNPLTGDVRTGYMGGAEYRISADFNGFTVKNYKLWQLPRSLQELNGINSERSVFGNTSRDIQLATFGTYRLILPVEYIGNPSAVDVIAIAHVNQPFNKTTLGDRLPNYGVVSTTNQQQPVLRRNAGINSRYVNDLRGDNPGLAPDILSTIFTTEYDQFRIIINFAQPINSLPVGFGGVIILDTDRSILTGDIPMGGEIARWGGDVQLTFNLEAGNVTLLIQDNSGGSVPFGPPQNDGRWSIQGNTLILEGSLSLFDTYSIKTNSSGSDYTRVQTDGRMYAQVSSTYYTQNGVQQDWLTPVTTAVDTSTGEVLESFRWDASKTVSIYTLNG